MIPTTVHRGRCVPLARTGVDTDAIIPAKHCLTVERTGFAQHLFQTWRDDPSFPLDDPARRGASVLVAGADFGTGSSREHAVWALQDWGFRAVVSSRFGDIFYANCSKAGLVAARVAEDDARAMLAASLADPDLVVTVDLRRLVVEWTTDGATHSAAVDMSPFTRRRFLEGLDDIDLTLHHVQAIERYERESADRLPTQMTGDRA